MRQGRCLRQLGDVAFVFLTLREEDLAKPDRSAIRILAKLQDV